MIIKSHYILIVLYSTLTSTHYTHEWILTTACTGATWNIRVEFLYLEYSLNTHSRKSEPCEILRFKFVWMNFDKPHEVSDLSFSIK